MYELVTVVTVCTSLAQPQTRRNANMQQGGRCKVPPLVRELLAMMASGRSGGRGGFLEGGGSRQFDRTPVNGHTLRRIGATHGGCHTKKRTQNWVGVWKEWGRV